MERERATTLLGRDGPNRVRWIFSHRRKVAEGLAIIEPRLSNLGGGVRKTVDHVLIGLVEEGVSKSSNIIDCKTLVLHL